MEALLEIKFTVKIKSDSQSDDYFDVESQLRDGFLNEQLIEAVTTAISKSDFLITSYTELK